MDLINLKHEVVELLQLLFEVLLGEHFKSWHLPDRVKRAEVDELVRLCHRKVPQRLRDLLESLVLRFENAARLVNVTLPEHGMKDVIA